MCDYDICLQCKSVLEKKSQARRAKLQRCLVGRTGRLEVSDVVCLKSLCDKVAQIELARKKEKRTVSVGVNTDSAEEDSSQCLTLVEQDRARTDSETDTDGEVPAAHEDTASRYNVEVHLPNGHCAGADTDKKHETPLIDQIRQLHGEETSRSNSCSHSFKEPPSLLSRLRLTSSSLASMSASPDIFHLRAPLVSWENFMTPSGSNETLAEL